MNDNKICRIVGEPSVRYYTDRHYFISIFIEKNSGSIKAGFTTSSAGGLMNIPAISLLEYRFDADQAEKLQGLASSTVFVSGQKVGSFIKNLNSRSKLTYRVNGQGTIEFKLQDIGKELAECGISTEELSALEVQPVQESTPASLAATNPQATALGVKIKGLSPQMAAAMKQYAPMMQAYGAQVGVSVIAVEPDTPAAKAGIMAGDMLIEFDGSPISEPQDVKRLVAATKPGSVVPLKVRRSGAIIALNARM
ncbi:PDZ domain-containing protein [Magnetospirillum sp. 15-1]|uniref:PDZ domain-containing protein n=1 Tax=Magnetospirillum sp. 15-1 TaxID=1979370 RepID=UPI0018D50D84|nr:PDZ domain-containing protein [Magnetospirillum sp. 15-1]